MPDENKAKDVAPTPAPPPAVNPGPAPVGPQGPPAPKPVKGAEGIPGPSQAWAAETEGSHTIPGGAAWVNGRLVDAEGKALPAEKIDQYRDHLKRTGRA